jgi:hypothetical protein
MYADSQVQVLSDYSSGQWRSINAAPFQIGGIAGENGAGVVAFQDQGNSVAYINDYTGTWVTLPNAPFTIQGITGDNHSGPAIFSGNQVAYLSNYATPGWVQLPHAPCQIGSISGNNRVGLVALDVSGRSLYQLPNYNGNWQQIGHLLPCKITGLSGDPTGVLAVGFNTIILLCTSFAAFSWNVLRGPQE